MHEIAELNNGIRIIHKRVNSIVAHCGLIINTGTRDEDINEHGIAHLTEHMLFKGTNKRRAFHVLSRMEDVGGEIDAFTTKEETYISTSFLCEYYERAIELINDIVFNSTFPNKEIEKEKEIIIEEINSYKDSPAEQIFDDFEEILYAEHPLGRSILGNAKKLLKYNSNDVKNFVNTKYNTDNMVFCSIGNIDFKTLLKFVKKHLEINPTNTRTYSKDIFNNRFVTHKERKIKSHQSHCILGTYAYNFKDPKRLPLILISNLLAGTGMNSRLNMALREKKAISYNIESNYTSYEDTGNFNIYFGADKHNTEQAIEIIFNEFNKLKSNKLGPIQLNKIKKQLIGQISIGNEINSNFLFSMGKSFLIYDHIETLNQTIEAIESVTAEQILDVANEILQKDNFSSLLYY